MLLFNQQGLLSLGCTESAPNAEVLFGGIAVTGEITYSEVNFLQGKLGFVYTTFQPLIQAQRIHLLLHKQVTKPYNAQIHTVIIIATQKVIILIITIFTFATP